MTEQQPGTAKTTPPAEYYMGAAHQELILVNHFIAEDNMFDQGTRDELTAIEGRIDKLHTGQAVFYASRLNQEVHYLTLAWAYCFNEQGDQASGTSHLTQKQDFVRTAHRIGMLVDLMDR